MPRLCKFYPGICLTTEKKARKNLSQGSRGMLVHIVLEYPHITKPTHTRAHITTPTHIHTHTLQNNIKPPQYKQTQNKIDPNDIVLI